MDGCVVHIFVRCKEILSFSALVRAQHATLQLTNANHASKADSETVCLEEACSSYEYEYPKNIPRKRCSTTTTFFQPACGVADYPSPGHFSFPPWWEASVWLSLQGQTTVRWYPVKSGKIMKAFCLMWRKFLICVIIRNSGRWDVISADPGASHLVPIYKSWEKDGRRTCIYCVHCSGTF